MSADSQFNGGPHDVQGLPEYQAAFPTYLSEFQVVMSPHLGNVLKTVRRFESVNHGSPLLWVRSQGQAICGKPVEFYQSHMQRSEWEIDYRSRREEFAARIRDNHQAINSMYFEAFKLRNPGESIDRYVDYGVERIFHYADYEMKEIIKSYLKQKPRRALVFFDIEAVDKANPKQIFRDPVGYFKWMEPALKTVQSFLQGFGVRTAVNVTGKGYHVFASVPLYEDGRHTDAMMELMQAGGWVQPETIDRLVTITPGEKHSNPTPILSQMAYQGGFRLCQFVVANCIDAIRSDMRRLGYSDHVGFTDDLPHQVSLDLTQGLRQVNMSCFGSPGSVYNKDCPYWIIRMPRSRDGNEFFGNDIASMISCRSDPPRAQENLIFNGCMIPDSTKGMERLILAYNQSRMKRELWDPLDQPFDGVFIAELINTNYSQYRARVPGLDDLLDVPSGAFHPFLDPAELKNIYDQCVRSGVSIWEMVHLTLAVCHDPVKGLDIHEFYSKAEKAKWPAVLFTEHFKG